MSIQQTSIDPNIAYITAPDGTMFQVLTADGTDWDEAATHKDYDAYQARLNASEAAQPEASG